MTFHERALSSASKLYTAVDAIKDMDFEAVSARIAEERREELAEHTIPFFASFFQAMQGLRSNRPGKARNSQSGRVIAARGERNRRHIARAVGPDGANYVLHATKGWRRESTVSAA